MEEPKLKRGNSKVFDIETNTLNKYTEDRVGEVYSIIEREINEDKVIAEIEAIKKGKDVNLNDGEYLKSFLSEPLHFRNMRDYITHLKEETQDCTRDVWAHNLDFEDNAVRCELKPNSMKNPNKINNYFEHQDLCIFRTNSNPIRLEYQELPNVTFKCSYAMTGYSIKTLGDIIGIPKLEYDYELIRRPFEELTEEEIRYNDNDVVISGCAIVQLALLKRTPIEKLSPTFTSAMKRDKQNFIIEHFGKSYYKNLIKKRQKQLEYYDYKFYELVNHVRQGGLTVLNPSYIGKVVEEIASTDIVSSYPYIMCYTKFPRFDDDTICYDEELLKTDKEANEELYNLFERYFIDGRKYWATSFKGWIGEIHLHNIKAIKVNKKIIPFLPLSKARLLPNEDGCLTFNNKTDKTVNGKIIECKHAIVNLTDIDYEQLLLCYEFEVGQINSFYITEKEEYLSLGEISFILDLFIQKQSIKPFKDTMKAQYNLSKQNINANYGSKQQDFIKGTAEVIDGQVIFNEFFDKYNENFDKRFPNNSREENIENYHKMVFNRNYDNREFDRSIDIMTDGAYISAKAKLRLLEMMFKLFEIQDNINSKLKSNIEIVPLYADTDSIKFTVNIKNSDSGKATNKEYKIDMYINIILKEINKFNDKIKKSNEQCYRFLEFCDKFELVLNEKEEEVYNDEDNKGLKKLVKNSIKDWKEYVKNNKTEIEFFEYLKTQTNIKASKKFKIMYNAVTKMDRQECILELGTWDIENDYIEESDTYLPYKMFKSYGAKKYLIINRNEKIKVETTVAGLNKSIGSKIKEYAEQELLDVYDVANEIFSIGTLFDRSISGRTVAYQEKRSDEELAELRYNGTPVEGKGCKMIESTSYTLNITENDFIYSFNTFNVKREEVQKVFLKTKNGKLMLLTEENDIDRYFKLLEVSHEKYLL